LLQVAAGLISVTGEPGRDGVRIGVSLIDHTTGMYAALAILAAVHAGGGATLDVSLWETALAFVSYHLIAASRADPCQRPGHRLPRSRRTGCSPAADGGLMITAANGSIFARLVEASACRSSRTIRALPQPRPRSEPACARRGPTSARLREDRRARGSGSSQREFPPPGGTSAVAADPQTEAIGILQRVGALTTLGQAFSVTRSGPRMPPRAALGEHSAGSRATGCGEEEFQRPPKASSEQRSGSVVPASAWHRRCAESVTFSPAQDRLLAQRPASGSSRDDLGLDPRSPPLPRCAARAG
jgi:hypothetical protein